MKEIYFSNLISYGKLIAGSIGAGAGTVSTYLYGDGSDAAIKLFLVLIALDWLSGIAAAKKDGTYSSAYGIFGVVRTIFILLLPAAGYYTDQILGLPETIFYFILTGLAFHIANSVAANVIRAGWSKWIPRRLLEKMSSFVQSEIEAKEKRSERKSNKQ